MPSFQQVIVIGRLGKDPEVHYSADGNAICSFSVASSEKWNDKNTGEKREKTEWHRIVCFKNLAEICGKYLSKGSAAIILGKLQTRKWTDKDGVDRYTTEIVAQTVQFLSPKNQSQPQEEYQNTMGPDSDDIPF